MTRSPLAATALWIGAVVALGLAAVGVFPVRVTAAERQDPPPSPTLQAQPATRSVHDGVFSEAQAARGDKIFSAQCGSCHKPEQFTGPFLDGWEGKTASGLFATIQTSMPENDPGSLARRDYADVLAFILKKNGLPAGPADLPSAFAELRQIIINK